MSNTNLGLAASPSSLPDQTPGSEYRTYFARYAAAPMITRRTTALNVSAWRVRVIVAVPSAASGAVTAKNRILA
jgi:hypothetical protein